MSTASRTASSSRSPTLRQDIEAGEPAGALHFPDTPWRKEVIVTFEGRAASCSAAAFRDGRGGGTASTRSERRRQASAWAARRAPRGSSPGRRRRHFPRNPFDVYAAACQPIGIGHRRACNDGRETFDVSLKTELCIAARALLAYLAARLAPPLTGLTDAGQAVLGVVLVGTIFWISEAVPLGVTALLVVALLAVNPGLRLPDALVGFTSEVTFFLIGAVAIGAAVETSGLAQRAAAFSPQRRRQPDPALCPDDRCHFRRLRSSSSAITRNAISSRPIGMHSRRMGVSKAGRVAELSCWRWACSIHSRPPRC